jgi:predicted transcriptional regulator
LLAHFVERQKLTSQDLEEVRRLLDAPRENRKAGRPHGKR